MPKHVRHSVAGAWRALRSSRSTVRVSVASLTADASAFWLGAEDHTGRFVSQLVILNGKQEGRIDAESELTGHEHAHLGILNLGAIEDMAHAIDRSYFGGLLLKLGEVRRLDENEVCDCHSVDWYGIEYFLY